MLNPALNRKRAAIIIAFRDFQDIEYFTPKEILEVNNIEMRTVSTNTGIAIGAYGGEAEVDIILEDLKVKDFDAIIFIGGGGCLRYLDNENAYKIVRETVSEKKVLASICISPVILAKSGVLKGKKAVVWSSPLDKSPIKALKEAGAVYLKENVVVDGNIITASGPSAAEEFGNKIVEMLR
ncbi:MAG: hypothetical protein A3H01_00365 [Candidatus Wildermuthbacteria bacterium RIFCSPLOWO2_12_FULL_40_9]|uniref:DJ-1/PfpI domain-containing protein n=1 Tax=Candidatus Wildermuthbacteria bacterium RIFCSPLOWO2_12_FULL_40_9 TaxID=1802467 RepID=A0A1G2RTU5_9BACT|nr:MAG: hypothetical protein A3H01_00365 [Candidatus Wildermuthbacteria bacterium RIFCSPLOWO2_12_FULL_40_9]